jgi:hypothetical protein
VEKSTGNKFDPSTEQSRVSAPETGDLWGQFCDQLKLAGEQILVDSAPDDPLTRAEGFRYLTRLLRLSLEKHIEFDNPHFPQFYSLSHETAKIGNDNPDNYYLNCAIEGSRDYRITGHRGSVEYLSIETKAGSFAAGGDMAPTGHIELSELELDAAGNFELIVSATEHPGNWLPMSLASDSLLVRQTFRNRSNEARAQLQIDCLNPVGTDTLNPANFAAQLQRVVPFVTGTVGLFSQWMDTFSAHINSLPANDQEMCQRAGGDPEIYYHNSYWRLGADEALVIEFTPPARCRAWNFQLSNYWMESLDYRYHRVCINNDSARESRDGSIRLVVAHSDPGSDYPNWLSTADHEVGAMLLRYVGASDHPPIDTRVVNVNELPQLAKAAPG